MADRNVGTETLANTGAPTGTVSTTPATPTRPPLTFNRKTSGTPPAHDARGPLSSSPSTTIMFAPRSAPLPPQASGATADELKTAAQLNAKINALESERKEREAKHAEQINGLVEEAEKKKAEHEEQKAKNAELSRSLESAHQEREAKYAELNRKITGLVEEAEKKKAEHEEHKAKSDELRRSLESAHQKREAEYLSSVTEMKRQHESLDKEKSDLKRQLESERKDSLVDAKLEPSFALERDRLLLQICIDVKKKGRPLDPKDTFSSLLDDAELLSRAATDKNSPRLIQYQTDLFTTLTAIIKADGKAKPVEIAAIEKLQRGEYRPDLETWCSDTDKVNPDQMIVPISTVEKILSTILAGLAIMAAFYLLTHGIFSIDLLIRGWAAIQHPFQAVVQPAAEIFAGGYGLYKGVPNLFSGPKVTLPSEQISNVHTAVAEITKPR